MTKGEKLVKKIGEVIKMVDMEEYKGINKKLKHTSRGSKLMNLVVAVDMCIFMCLLAFAQVLN